MHRKRRSTDASIVTLTAGDLLHGMEMLPEPRMPASRKGSGDILPTDAETYDFSAGGRGNRKYFDGSFKARRYAELIGREASTTEANVSADACGREDRTLPLAFRRVLSATLPSSRSCGVSDQAALQFKADLEARLAQHLGTMRASTGRRTIKQREYRPARRATVGVPLKQQHRLSPGHVADAVPRRTQARQVELPISSRRAIDSNLGGESPEGVDSLCPAEKLLLRTCIDLGLGCASPEVAEEFGPGESPVGLDGWDVDSWDSSWDPNHLDSDCTLLSSVGDGFFVPLLDIPEEESVACFRTSECEVELEEQCWPKQEGMWEASGSLWVFAEKKASDEQEGERATDVADQPAAERSASLPVLLRSTSRRSWRGDDSKKADAKCDC